MADKAKQLMATKSTIFEELRSVNLFKISTPALLTMIEISLNRFS